MDNKIEDKHLLIAAVIVFLFAMSVLPPPAIIFLAIAMYASYKWYKEREISEWYEGSYGHIIDVDAEYNEALSYLAHTKSDIERLKEDYKTKREVYYNLKRQVDAFSETLELIDMGVYEPHFSFDSSNAFKAKIKEVRAEQSKLIKDEGAFFSRTSLMVDGSAAEGKKVSKRIIKLTARAFNNEANMAISDVTWNNVARMSDRIERAFESINKTNESSQVVISPAYLELKLKELRLTYEMKEKVQLEKDALIESRRQEREEQQSKKEYEAALMEEQKLQQLLDTIQQKAKHSVGAELESMEREVARLGQELRDMQKSTDRVKAMAQQTKIGYVYVISNIGSFGENIYKIGMTRRLDPMDRIKELGSASVPFYFDVHAMVFSQDAPALEAELQRHFTNERVNLVNHRKEYFSANIEDIKRKVWEYNPNVEFYDQVEAREYRETLQLRHPTRSNQAQNRANEAIPLEL